MRFGTLASFYLVDDRQYRDPQACTRGGKSGSSTVNPAPCAEWQDPKRSLLGADQERWLDDAFAHGSRGWNVVGLQSLFGARELGSGRAPIVLERRLGRLSGRARPHDRLDAQAPARQSRAAGRRRAPELGGPREGRLRRSEEPFDRRGILRHQHHGAVRRRRPNQRVQLAKNPHFVFADAERRGYGVVEFTPKRLTTSLRVVDDVTRRDTRIETLAKFSVEAGRSVIVAE